MGLYFENRQNVTRQSEAELDEIFKYIADHFKHDWLKSKKGGHPLQLLWNRRDALSTNELFAFGHCLKEMSQIDSAWTKKQVQEIKIGQLNNRLGAFFEINALGFLKTNDQNIVPTKGNNPGFDGILTLDTSKEMRISLKNYGDSAHYREFHDQSRKLENAFKACMKAAGVSAIHVTIDFPKSVPVKKDWKDLHDHLPGILAQAKKKLPVIMTVHDRWIVNCSPLVEAGETFHPNHNSHTIIISCPYHKNEEKNLLDKLDEACANLVKHSSVEDEKIINVVFVHLSESASIIRCAEWSREYFENFPEKPITGIILFQPTIAKDMSTGASMIHNCFQLIFREERYNTWNTNARQINFSIPIGITNQIPTEAKIIYEIDGKPQAFDLKNRYVFQKGSWFLEQKKDAKGNISGNMKNVASGIIAHAVLQPFPGQASLVMAPHSPPDDKLLIL